MMKRILFAALLAAALPLAGVTGANAASLSGSWSGTGMVYPANGKAEKTRCRVSFSKISESQYRVNAKCASTSGKASQVATVSPAGKNKYSGSFYNKQHNTSGSLTITLRGNRQTVSMSSTVGSAKLTLRKN